MKTFNQKIKPGWIFLLIFLLAQAARAYEMPTFPIEPTNVPLDSWSFNDPNGWTSDYGYVTSYSYDGQTPFLLVQDRLCQHLNRITLKNMGKTKGPMQQEYPTGSLVKIVSREMLEEYMRTWKYHHKLQPEQLEFAGKIGKVELYGFYHGGDELYKVEGAPGIWHEQCLEVYMPPS